MFKGLLIVKLFSRFYFSTIEERLCPAVQVRSTCLTKRFAIKLKFIQVRVSLFITAELFETTPKHCTLLKTELRMGNLCTKRKLEFEVQPKNQRPIIGTVKFVNFVR